MREFLSTLALMLLSLLAFENHGLRSRLRGVESEYQAFLSLRSGGGTLKDRIMPGTFSVFSHNGVRLACAGLGPARAGGLNALGPSSKYIAPRK